MNKTRLILCVFAVILALSGAYLTFETSPLHILEPDLPIVSICLIDSVVLFLLCAVFSFGVLKGRFKSASVLRKSAAIALWAVILWGLYYIPTLFGVSGESTVVLSCIITGVSCIAAVVVYCVRSKRTADQVSSNAIRKSAASSAAVRYAYSILVASMIVLMLGSVVLLCLYQDNWITIWPLASAILGILVWRLTGWRGALLIPILATVFFGASSLMEIVMVTGFASEGSGLTAPLVFLLIEMLTATSDLYTRADKIA